MEPSARKIGQAKFVNRQTDGEIAMGKIEFAPVFGGSNSPHQAMRSAVLPSSLPPRGLCREVAAAYIGVGGTKFDLMVKEGVMPKPRKHGGRRLWDRAELDAAFSELPHDGEKQELANPWDEILD